MEPVYNSDGKLICRIDTEEHLVEIVRRGIVTTIAFLDDGNIKIQSMTKE